MKKADYFKQSISEVLSDDISLENGETFKTYMQLKALCFQKELKEDCYIYKNAVKRFDEKVISYLINEGYVYRVDDDSLVIPEISDNVNDVVDYSKINSIRGKIGIQKGKLNKMKVSGLDTSEIEERILELELSHIEEKNKVNGRLNTRLTIKNKTIEDKTIKDNRIEDKTKKELNDNIKDLNNNKENNNKEDLNNNREDLNDNTEDLNDSKEDLNNELTKEEKRLMKKGYKLRVIRSAIKSGIKLT